MFVRNFASRGDLWVPGTILNKGGPLTYHVRLENGDIRKRYVDHLRICTSEAPSCQVGDMDWYPAGSFPSDAPDPPAAITQPHRSTRNHHPP